MLQPLLVSAGDEEQVEHTCFLENTDGQMDRWTDASCCHCCHCHHVHLMHGGGGLRASAGGLSSIAWDAVAVIVHRCYAQTLRTVHMLTVQIWECGKAGSCFGTLDSDGPAHLVPLTEGYEYSGRGSVLIHTTCLVGKCNSSWHWWH